MSDCVNANSLLECSTVLLLIWPLQWSLDHNSQAVPLRCADWISAVRLTCELAFIIFTRNWMCHVSFMTTELYYSIQNNAQGILDWSLLSICNTCNQTVTQLVFLTELNSNFYQTIFGDLLWFTVSWNSFYFPWTHCRLYLPSSFQIQRIEQTAFRLLRPHPHSPERTHNLRWTIHRRFRAREVLWRWSCSTSF